MFYRLIAGFAPQPLLIPHFVDHMGVFGNVSKTL